MSEYTYQWNHEWASDPSMPILKITKSSLNTFEFCRKQYEFSYIEGRKTEPNPAMIKGTVIHNSYEHFYNNFDIKKAEGLSQQPLYEYCMGLFPIDDYGEMYQTMATFEAERFLASKDSIGSFLPVGNELKCNAQVIIPKDANPKFELSRNYVVHLQGIIDRIFLEGDGYIPVEFKTGVWKPRKATGMRKEMAFYKVLMDNDPDCELSPVTHWGWYFPAANYFHVEKVKTRNENDVVKRIATIIYSYEQNLFPAEYYYNKCQYCSFIGICDTAQNAGMWEW